MIPNCKQLKYSSEEIKIGKINNENVYSKVIRSNSFLAPNSSIAISHQISNLKEIIKADLMVTYENEFYPSPISYDDTTKIATINKVNSTNIILRSGNESWGSTTFTIILEYTKNES